MQVLTRKRNASKSKRRSLRLWCTMILIFQRQSTVVLTPSAPCSLKGDRMIGRVQRVESAPAAGSLQQNICETNRSCYSLKSTQPLTHSATVRHPWSTTVLCVLCCWHTQYSLLHWSVMCFYCRFSALRPTHLTGTSSTTSMRTILETFDNFQSKSSAKKTSAPPRCINRGYVLVRQDIGMMGE